MKQFLLYVIVGFGAQLVDGAIGMAYGIISTTFLLSLGIPPVVASAGVHTAEIVTTGLSGLSHAMFKNVDYLLFRRVMIPGVIGAITGAYILTQIPSNISKPVVAIYLFVMGTLVLYRALQGNNLLQDVKKFFIKKILKHRLPSDHARGLIPLGLAGGFFDASGGGGWGPIVTSSLLAQGATPHLTIGSVNLAEFLVTLTASLTFFLTIGITHWFIILGLITGGAIAAPFAAYMVRRIHPRMLMIIAGILVILLSVRNFIVAFQ